MSAVYISSRAFKASSMRETINLALRHGFTHIELTYGLDYSDDIVTTVRGAKDKINFLVHHYFPPPKVPFVLNLASGDSEILQQSLELCENAIRLCVVLGSPFYTVHGGYAIDFGLNDFEDPDGMTNIILGRAFNYEKAYSTFVESIRRLNDYAKQWGIKLLVENNAISSYVLRTGAKNPMLMIKADEFERLKRDIPDDNLGFMIDLAHLEVSSNAMYFNKLYFLERIRSWVYALHLSDNDGSRDSNEPITHASWFIPILKTFTDIPMIIHTSAQQPEQLRQQIDMVIRYRKPGTGALISRDE
jgi:sugar phosphate isomerase/epimerase